MARRLTALALLLGLAGCGEAPKKEDYSKPPAAGEYRPYRPKMTNGFSEGKNTKKANN